jgi:predicted Zn-dependent protease
MEEHMKIAELSTGKSLKLSRREFIWLSSMSAAGLLVSCATDPVTGQKVFNMVSEEQEISIDKQYTPQQFSSDYGPVQDAALNSYIDQLGQQMGKKTHRPHMPYSFRVVNANYINAYAFPGGSIATTRGILLKLDNEAQLAALLGHELGHVNARHSAESMSKGQIAQLGVGLGSVIAAATLGSGGGQLVGQLGMVGASALLATYSRANEREADALGMEYLVENSYSPMGMVGLMEVLDSLHKGKTSAVQTLFSTHPMSTERLETAQKEASGRYQTAKSLPLHHERYMDHTARLRKMEPAIEQMQKAEGALAKKNYDEAEKELQSALRKLPNDYTGLMLLSKCNIAQKDYSEALKYAEKARKAYPQEAQSRFYAGYSRIKLKKFDRAYQDFSAYDKLLSGNPASNFYKGYAMENMGRKSPAAKHYISFLEVVTQGDEAKHSFTRLVQWGYIDKNGRRLK